MMQTISSSLNFNLYIETDRPTGIWSKLFDTTNDFRLQVFDIVSKKSRIRETPTLSTNADSKIPPLLPPLPSYPPLPPTEEILWTFFVNPFCGYVLWTLFVDTLVKPFIS